MARFINSFFAPPLIYTKGGLIIFTLAVSLPRKSMFMSSSSSHIRTRCELQFT
ncbi:hypothetical protein EVA_10658 [gut metagenome]|uniref:Uncharacterized protein n=1 Tax=gut metagenome TaxID=749906 RepID=J9GH98_9ZZZZ